jgi:hypothetical protein
MKSSIFSDMYCVKIDRRFGRTCRLGLHCRKTNKARNKPAGSRPFPTAATRVRAQVRSCRICGGQSGTGAGFLWVVRSPLPILIPPTAPHSSSIIWGWHNRPVSGRRTKWTQSHSTLTHSRSWALLEKFPIVQLLKNFTAFYGTRRFINVFTWALHWSLS